jgi:hypothetical protein
MGKAESPPDQPAAWKNVLDFFGRSAGGHIEILGDFSEQQVANAAAHQKCFVTRILQVADNFGRVPAKFFQPNAMFGLGNGDKIINIVLRAVTG